MRAAFWTVCLVGWFAASTAFSQEGWISLGPPGGSFGPTNLVVDPFTADTLYVTDFGDDGASGLWKSSDGGRHWRSINAGLEQPYISSIAADSFRADTLFAAVISSLRRTDDGGETWTEVYQSEFGGGGMSQLIADPVTPGDLWFQNYGDVGHSKDGGATWSIAHVGNGGSAMDIAVDPLNPQNVYFSDNAFLWKSTDRGASWNWLYGPNSLGLDWVVPASRPPAVLYARPTLTYGTPPAPRHCVRSDDQGATWTPMPLPDPKAICTSLILDPLDSRHLWVLDVLQHKLFVSTDGGATWPEVHDGLPADISSLFRRDHQTGVLYLGTGSGVSRSDDNGETWEDASRGIVSTTVESLFAVRGAGGSSVLFAQARFHPMVRSLDGGRTWRDLSVGGSALATDATNPAHLFLAASRLYESHDTGKTWTRLGSFPVAASHLVVNPANPRVLYVAGPGAAVFRSRDGGRTWQRASAGLPVDPPCENTFCYPSLVYGFTIDPVDPRVLVVVVEGKVFRSTDAGRRWRPAALAEGVTALAQHPRSRALYAVGGSLSRSTDGGAIWKEVGPVPATLTELLVDPRGGVLYAASQEGVFRSKDQGKTWDSVTEGLPFNDVRHIALDPSSPGLFAAVGGAGVWGRRF